MHKVSHSVKAGRKARLTGYTRPTPIPSFPPSEINMTDPAQQSPANTDDAPQALLQEVAQAASQLREQVAQAIVGQDEVIEQLFICLFTKGHGLLVGVPGLAKTLLVSTVAQTLSLEFNRIQFTPDLMPAEDELVTYEEQWTGEFVFENEWQSFRTRKDRELELISTTHRYAEPGRYRVAVKVVDIFGNDTMTLIPVTIY